MMRQSSKYMQRRI